MTQSFGFRVSGFEFEPLSPYRFVIFDLIENRLSQKERLISLG